MKTKMKPKRTDLPYLTGWFAIDAQCNYREARRLAREYKAKEEKKNAP